MSSPAAGLFTRRIAGLTTLLAASVLTGCGEDGARGDDPAAGDEAITVEAIAAVALEHVDLEASSAQKFADQELDGLGVGLRFGADGESDGDLLRVHVGPPSVDEVDCEEPDAGFDGCEWSEVDGGRMLVAWQEEAPEEDPGIVLVAMLREDEQVTAYYAGDSFTGDPREAELSVEVESMVDVVQDERLSLTTSADVVELGDGTKDLFG